MKCVMGLVRPSAGRILADIDGVQPRPRQAHHRADRRPRHRPGAGRPAPVSQADRWRRTCCSAPSAAPPAPRCTATWRAASRPSRASPERRSQLAGSMCGGEQQMLALGRALMLAPKILLVDEPSVGLAPLLVARTIDAIKELKDQLSADRADGRAELHPGRPHRRPRLRHRPRQNRRRRRSAQDELNDNELIRKFYLGL